MKEQQINRMAFVWLAKDGFYKLLIHDNTGYLRNFLIASARRKDLENVLHLIGVPFITSSPPKEMFKDVIRANIKLEYEVMPVEKEIQKIKVAIDKALDEKDFSECASLKRRLDYLELEGCYKPRKNRK